ncbi:MAG TPA: TetR/AcrR family transcriptional regulator [Dehalococcoidia bacterium]|nr:TetR/AcrR family transcriptional regulator [Dehalococcoidia bacterium]
MGRTSDARERLLQVAAQLIHARSYADVSVDDLCTAAGVNKGSFYYYFPAKRDLALAAVEAQWQQVRTTLLEPAFARDLPPLARFPRLFDLVAARHATRAEQSGCVLGCPFGNLALELSTRDEVVRAKLQEVFAGYCVYFETALAEAAAAGEIAPANVAPAAQAVLALLEGALLLAKTANDAGVVSRLGSQVVPLIRGAGGSSAFRANQSLPATAMREGGSPP